MPTGEIAPQRTPQIEGNHANKKFPHIPGISPINSVPEKVNYFGIEVQDKVTWKGWEQGKEYIRTIVLKNLGIKTQKLKYIIPSTRFFTTLFPKPIFMSAGASFTLPVTFRPLENIEYNDKIVFILKSDEKFEVPLRALLPQMDISLPLNLDFKMCAVQDNIFILFEVFNIGDLDTPLKWQVSEPFTIEPAEIELKHRSSAKFKATFQPKAAFVYEVIAVCRFGRSLELAGHTTFSGIGKFPHLLVSCPDEIAPKGSQMTAAKTEVNFGRITVAFTAEHYVELRNLSPVQTSFHVERLPGMRSMNSVFRCLQTRGVVPPMSIMKLRILYSPQTVNLTSLDYFRVTCKGNVSHSIIKCSGTAIGPSVQLSTKSIIFPEVDIGSSAVQPFEIINNSDVEAVYQFELDCEESVFKLSIISGFVKPRSRQTVILEFVPKFPINYYRRVAFLVHNQLPSFLDLLATCHSGEIKPVTLRTEHLVRYHTHLERGLSIIAPEQLNEHLQAGRLVVDKNGCLDLVIPEDKSSLRTNPNPKNISAVDEYFNDGFHSDTVNVLPHVSLSVHVLDFGNVHSLNVLQEKTVNITNHTKGKVTAHWMGDPSHIFSVSPASLDIPPLKACSFRVTFKAAAHNQIYGNELECFVSYKSLRDYKLVQEITLCTPWCLTVKCLGHTFLPSHDKFLPRAVIQPRILVFPAINTGESSCQTVLVANDGDTPIMYDLKTEFKNLDKVRAKCGSETNPQRDIFVVKPCKGLLRSGYQIFSVRMSPSELHMFSQQLLFRLNDDQKYDQVVHLCGSAETAQVVLDGEGNMYFKTTCAGTSSSRSYSFKNVSRIPIRFVWKLNKEDKKFLTVEPDAGVVQPNESVSQTWTFTPDADKKYVLKATLVAWGQGLNPLSPGGKKQFFSLRIIAEGCYGELQSDQAEIDFGDILVGSFSVHPINIFNNSNCSLHYRLTINEEDCQTKDPKQKEPNAAIEKPCVEFDSMEGEVPARGKHSIMATVRPVRRMHYQFEVSYQLVMSHSETTNQAILEPQHLIHLVATGVYPSMSVSDVRAHGSAIGISKKSLWGLFSLNSLNECLNSDPPANGQISQPGHANVGQCPPLNTSLQNTAPRYMLDFNFSAAPFGSEPCTITIMFQNSRTVLCEWVFLFPKDVQLEMEHWSEHEESDDDQLNQMKVDENSLFEVSPIKGCLHPGETVMVTLTYKHDFAGTHHLPVMLKIAKGKEIMLSFTGVTVSHTRPYIHFPSNKHMFNPMPIGEKVSPNQFYELYNGGAVPVSFEADLTPLDIIKKENFDHSVFECLTPRGNILPGQTLAMEWRFSPLEAKTYMVDLPIKIHNDETAVLTFSGVGYDPRVLADTMAVTDEQNTSCPPSIQIAEVPGQLGYLSMERISFGNLPLASQARRMLFVTNKSSDRSIFFEWHVTSQNDTKFLQIYPIRGKIRPNDYKMCRVTFLAVDAPAFFDLDLVCEISDLHEYTNYKKELAAWEMERERQVNEFTCTETDLHADMRSPRVVTYVGGPSSGRVSKLEALAESGRTFGITELSKYKTLPPIRQLTADEQRLLERKQQNRLSQLWQKPQSQKPFLLHLGITARTHDHSTYQLNFPDEFSKFYIDRALSQQHQLLEPYQQDTEVPTLIECSSEEAKVIGSVFGSCLRSLLDDSSFIQAIRKVMREPVPYFCQFMDLEPEVASLIAQNQLEASMGMNFTEVDNSDNEEENKGSMVSLSSFSLENPAILEQEIEEMSTQESTIAPIISNKSLESNRLEFESLKHSQSQAMKRLPEVGHALEHILENTLLNLMYEAMSSEFSIVSRPRLIAMPRKKLTDSNIIYRRESTLQ